MLKINFNSVDVIDAVKVCQERFLSRKIAVIGHPSLALAAEIINQISDIPIEIYTLEGPQVDIHRIADQIHVNNCLALSNRETLYRVISEAVNTVHLCLN